MNLSGSVTAVARSTTHNFSKSLQPTIRLIAGLGVEHDAHAGVNVKHRSRVAKDPNQPNLRQVHLIHEALFDELRHAGFNVQPGDLGENITTREIDLLRLPAGSRLSIGSEVILRLTGLRNPCLQIDRFQQGLMSAVLGRNENGGLVRKAGVMSVVLVGGEVSAGDRIQVDLPAEPHQPLAPV